MKQKKIKIITDSHKVLPIMKQENVPKDDVLIRTAKKIKTLMHDIQQGDYPTDLIE